METRFDVYGDFMSYKSGVYIRTALLRQGGHAIKIVGWGDENGINYWICANSWGPAWGESGYFRIINDKDPKANWKTGIAETTIACQPDLTRLQSEFIF